MSLVVSWIGVDTHGVTSAYIASESRVSWKDYNRHIEIYDSCRKTFYIRNYPEILSYCGDVLFPSLLLSTIIDSIENGMIFTTKDNAIERYNKFKKILFNEFQKYPKSRMGDTFELLYINKDIIGDNYPSFYAYVIGWNKKSGFRSRSIKFPNSSGLLYVMGSGKIEFTRHLKEFQKKRSKGTSRNIYQCFADLIIKINDKHCGGPPQLVGIYRKPNTNGFAFGLIHERKRYYNGINVGKSYNDKTIQWRNRYFEICDASKKKRREGAQNQEIDLK